MRIWTALVAMLLPLSGPAGAEPPTEGPVTEVVEPGPWTLVFADGNGNVTRVGRALGQTTVSWVYEPIRPEESSSGTYSGGAPGRGEVAPDRALALWEQVRAVQRDPAAEAVRREMGTGRLSITTVGGSVQHLVSREPTAALAEQFAAVRGDNH